ncbi:MAG: hypothetical protein BWX88_05338 [Planctomycetes bacterium ADurb.Bin126]|nr:MAG: hypothetical protein BWX88_05338 [Planctomycetes bacterium ADurb.Bin126]
MISSGMRYSNIEPDHDTSTGARPPGASWRPSENQCSTGNCPRATPRKLPRRDSLASRS